jgi:hypothetical protein
MRRWIMGRIVIKSGLLMVGLGMAALGGSSHITSNKSNCDLICIFDQFGLLVNCYALQSTSRKQ